MQTKQHSKHINYNRSLLFSLFRMPSLPPLLFSLIFHLIKSNQHHMWKMCLNVETAEKTKSKSSTGSQFSRDLVYFCSITIPQREWVSLGWGSENHQTMCFVFWHQGSNAFYFTAWCESRGKATSTKKILWCDSPVSGHQHFNIRRDYGHQGNKHQDMESVSSVELRRNVLCFCCFFVVFLLFTIYGYFVRDITRCLRLSPLGIFPIQYTHIHDLIGYIPSTYSLDVT